MECNQCHQNLDGKPCWGSTDAKTGESVYLCEDCFTKEYGADNQDIIDLAAPIEDEVICQFCHRVLAEDEEYMEDEDTGECFCLPCFNEHRAELMPEDN